MPQSKTHSSRAQKLAKRRADQQRRAVPQTYVVMLDQLRAVLNKRFYEEQGFPHLEILAERYKGPVTTGHLSNYFELQHFFIGMGPGQRGHGLGPFQGHAHGVLTVDQQRRPHRIGTGQIAADLGAFQDHRGPRVTLIARALARSPAAVS